MYPDGLTEPSLKIQSIISVSKCDDPSDYESDDYNDSDYNYNSGNLSAKNETLLEEIIIIGNVSYSLDDLPTYNVTINLNLPEIKSLKEPVNSLDTDSKLRHDTVRLSRTRHTDKTQAGLTSRNQICLDESLCT